MPIIDTTHQLKNKNWTEIVAFPLEKYSRATARPNLLPESTQTASQPVNSFDWSHFTQPTLSLLVETSHADSQRASGSGNLTINGRQEISLKVVWESNPQSQPGNSNVSSGPRDGPGVFQLEKINLTEVQESFGHLRIGEIPLKANCKDRVVAIRYATGQMAGSFVFNRIQIKLQTLVDCFKFIAIIETICPCKMSSSTTVLSSKIQTSQDSRNAVSPFPGNMNPSDSLESSQPAVEINKNSMETLKEPTMPTQIFRVANTDAPDLTSITAQNQGHQIRKSPILPQKGHGAAASYNYDLLPEKIADLDNLSDENLMGYVREIAMEPGFECLVKHVKKLMPHE